MRVEIAASTVARLYRNGMSIKQLAAKFECTRWLILCRLREAGQPRRMGTDRLELFREAKRKIDAGVRD